MPQKKKFKTETRITGGSVGISVDTSEFFKSFVVTKRRVDELKLEIARMVIPFYERLILRTPVWRGTARMHWDLKVDNKFYNANKGRGKAPNRNLIDRGLERVANKLGSPRSADTQVTSNPEKLGLTKRRYGKDRKLISTQSQFGVNTDAVGKMVKAARKNIMDNFQVVEGGEGALSRKRSAKISVITISNDLPYIKFLEGPSSPYGAAYTSGSSIWREKEGSSDFVNPAATSKYRKGFIFKQVASLKGEFTRFLSNKKASDYKIR